ncbi:hypothetical protein FXO38_11794 [Capsicum annuum]|nr:hypothetical protein FXO38_11794 [Capsicum annuum]
MVTKAFVAEDQVEWWIDTGPTRHISGNRNSFKTYELVGDSKIVYMGNSSSTQVVGKGTVELKFTSGKIVTLMDVLHVPDIRKNLVSGYVANGMFKLNIENENISAYLVESLDLWHERLGHVNFRSIQLMVNNGLIKYCGKNHTTKCLTCSKCKITKKPFKTVESTSTLLQLIHIDIYEMNYLSRDGKRRKIKFDGTLDKYKARLVAKGFTQLKDIDYFNTFAPVARMTSIRLLIALAIIHGFVIHQIDVKTTFLNGDLNEEFYMKQPEGFVNPGQENDMLIFGTDIERVKEIKYFLASQFEMKDLREVDVILGIKIVRSASGLTLNQSSYIEKVLKRPDIGYAVGILSKFIGSPRVEHWNALIRVLRYLKGTINIGLHYSTFLAVLEGYSDATWNSDPNDSKSITAWIITLAGAAISWRSKKQTCITHLIMESEFIAMSSAGEEADWLWSMLIDVSLWGKPIPPLTIYCDNKAAIFRASSDCYNGKSRQVRLKHNHVRILLEDGIISLQYVKSKLNLTDPLSKGLGKELVVQTCNGMRMKPVVD